MSASPERSDPAGLLAAWLRLSLTPGLGDAGQRSLLAAFGLPDQIFAASRSSLARVVGDRLAAVLVDADREVAVDEHLAWAAEPDHHVLTLADGGYPRPLLATADPPTVLFAKGRADLLNRTGIAIVGARSATVQGTSNARAFAANLSRSGLTIISGLALGIDAAAHEGGLEGEGGTIGVIGTGPDRIYPSRNQDLARRIAREGLILSEFPLGTPARRHHFPRRNRILSGLARGVLVVEAAVGSGSLITARLAAEQGREVFAIPGSIHSPLSRGCHRLIREGAKLVESAGDVLEELEWTTRTAPPVTAPPPETGDTDEAGSVLAGLGYDPVDTDTLLQRSGLTPDALSAILLTMELDGRIARLPGGRFQRIQ